MTDQATTTISANEVTTTTTITAADADLATSTVVTLPTPIAKPGYRTSEFWLKCVAMVLSALFASGVLTTDTALAIAGMAATVLTALGYTVARTMVKTGALVLLLAVLPGLALTSSCSRGAVGTVGQIAWDCTEPQRAEAVAVLTPLATSAIRAAASADGKLVDATLLRAALGTANLKTQVGSILMCAAAEAFAALIAPSKPSSVGPAAAPFELDGAAARAAFDRLRNEQFPGVRLTTGRGVL